MQASANSNHKLPALGARYGAWHAGRWALTALRLGLMVSAAFGVLRLAGAELEFRRDTPPAVLRAASIGNSEYLRRLAELEPERARDVLRAATGADPRAAAVWIALGLSEERWTENRLAEERGVEKHGVEKRAPKKQPGENAGATPGRSGDFGRARKALEMAFRLDRQYAPAWALANFCFRRADQECFWRAALRAAAHAPGVADISGPGGNVAANLLDLRPLLDLAERMEPSPAALLDRLEITQETAPEETMPEGTTALRGAHLEKAYLDDLINQNRWQNRWEDATIVARRLASRHAAANTACLDDFVNRLIAAGRGAAAVGLWNDYAGFAALEPARGLSLTNGDFASAPREAGFDWRLGLNARGAVSGAGRQASGAIEPRWKPELVEFHFPGGEPEQAALAEHQLAEHLLAEHQLIEHLLAEQWLPLRAGSFRLRFEYSTRDLPSPTGIRWEFASPKNAVEFRAEAPPLEPSEPWRDGQWKFSADGRGPAPLRLMYRREPGTEQARGVFLIRHVRLEIL